MKKTTLDIVTSAYNEEECLPELFNRIEMVMRGEKNYSYRIIIIDNGSTDSTWSLILRKSKTKTSILGIRMSRNFPLDAAFTCGLDRASAQLAIVMTSDLQDPPEIIPDLLRKFEQGYDQVLVRIASRKTVPIARRVMSYVFYKLASRLTDGMLPMSVSDFRLLSRKTYLAMGKLRENHRFLRGIGSWVGFKTTSIEMERPPRFAGESKWLGISLSRVIGQATRSILAYSATPLMWVSATGLVLSGISIVGIAGLSISWIIGGVPFAGYGTIVGLICLGFSLTMLCIGILAQYLALIYEEVKGRPLYIVSEEI